MKIAILGFGREGRSALKFLKRSKAYKGAEISVLDRKDGPNYLRNLEKYDPIFRSPGVPYNLPEIQRAIKAGRRVTSATKEFFRICKAPIIGITGTKGKGTTSTLIYKILRAAGKKVLLAGNIGKSPLEILPKIGPRTVVVLELSSFQLWDLERSPKIAVVTDIFPDHMDVHTGMAEYLAAKGNIAAHQKKGDAVFYFESNPLSVRVAKGGRGKKIPVAAPDTLEKNRVLGAAVGRYLGCPEKTIARVVRNYKGLEHRLELVAERNGIRYFNDSASTNPQTTAAAIGSFNEALILIAGGKDKNLDYKPMARAVKKNRAVKMAILIGENKEKIAGSLKGSVPVKFSGDLASALQLARNRANASGASIILFSPGSASFDMFKDYADRGEQFKKLVRK